MSCDIVMGNVKPLYEKIAKLEAQLKAIQPLDPVQKYSLDKSKEYVRTIVEGEDVERYLGDI